MDAVIIPQKMGDPVNAIKHGMIDQVAEFRKSRIVQFHWPRLPSGGYEILATRVNAMGPACLHEIFE